MKLLIILMLVLLVVVSGCVSQTDTTNTAGAPGPAPNQPSTAQNQPTGGSLVPPALPE